MLLGNEYYIERFLIQALQLDDSYPDAHLYLGMYYLDQGNIEKARLHLQTAVQLAGEGPIGQQAQHILNQFFP
jgi:Tfp pilus assembly protein PilF